METRQQMIDFILNHFTYYLRNSWDWTTGYALNIKIPQMDFDEKTEGFMYETLSTGELHDILEPVIRDCVTRLQDKFSCPDLVIDYNGGSDGYLVLYYNRTCDYADQTYDEEELEDMGDTKIMETYDLLCEFDSLKEKIKNVCIRLVQQYEVAEEGVG